MTYDDFMNGGKTYIGRMLSGVCQHPDRIELAAYRIDQSNRVRFLAKLHPEDLLAIADSDTAASVKTLVRQVGHVKRDPTGVPFDSELKFHDPTFDSATYDPVGESDWPR